MSIKFEGKYTEGGARISVWALHYPDRALKALDQYLWDLGTEYEQHEDEDILELMAYIEGVRDTVKNIKEA